MSEKNIEKNEAKNTAEPFDLQAFVKETADAILEKIGPMKGEFIFIAGIEDDKDGTVLAGDSQCCPAFFMAANHAMLNDNPALREGVTAMTAELVAKDMVDANAAPKPANEAEKP